jgi:hypothetical protein
MLERWERIYRVFFYSLLTVVAVLVLWKLLPELCDVLVNGGWRPRAAFAFLISYYVTLRLIARTARFHALIMYWHRSLPHIVCYNLLFVVSPLAVALYLAPLRNPALLLLSIGLPSLLAAVIEWRARPTHS